MKIFDLKFLKMIAQIKIDFDILNLLIFIDEFMQIIIIKRIHI